MFLRKLHQNGPTLLLQPKLTGSCLLGSRPNDRSASEGLARSRRASTPAGPDLGRRRSRRIEGPSKRFVCHSNTNMVQTQTDCCCCCCLKKNGTQEVRVLKWCNYPEPCKELTRRPHPCMAGMTPSLWKKSRSLEPIAKMTCRVPKNLRVILWVDEIRVSHHFETMGNHCLLVFTGETSFQGVLGGAEFIHTQYGEEMHTKLLVPANDRCKFTIYAEPSRTKIQGQIKQPRIQ